MNTLFYKSFIFSVMLNGNVAESIEGCDGSKIHIQDEVVKIELIMPNGDKRLFQHKLLDESEFPTLWIDKGFLTFNLRPNGEAEYSKLINQNKNQYLNIVFRLDDCPLR
jgi:hypothetical protein